MAAKELEEECGLVIEASELQDLTQLAYGDRFKGMYPSAGGCDEFMRLFVYRKQVTKEKMDELQVRVMT